MVAEAPSNLILKYMKPSVWQARVIVSVPRSQIIPIADEVISLGVSFCAAMRLLRMPADSTLFVLF
jgi:hypothetical protein